MARFDVYANPDRTDRKWIPFVLDIQNDHLEGLETRVVVPLWTQEALPLKVRGLNPELLVDGRKVIMDTASLGAIPTAELRRPLDNLAARRLEIQDALDTLFGGY